MKRLILRARIDRLALEHAARVLPNLAAAVPMEAKLRKLGSDLRLLRLGEGDPNPLAHHLGQREGVLQATMQEIQNLLGRKLPVRLPLLAVNVKQPAGLCRCRCCRCRCLLRCRLMIAGLDSEPWRCLGIL